MFLCDPQAESPEVVLENNISVKAAAEFLGQVWLIKIASLETYLRNGQVVRDRRHGPRRVIAETGKKDAMA